MLNDSSILLATFATMPTYRGRELRHCVEAGGHQITPDEYEQRQPPPRPKPKKDWKQKLKSDIENWLKLED